MRIELILLVPAGKPDFDTRLPLCPPDISVILYGRISNPEWKVPWHSVLEIARSFSSNSSSSSLSRASSTSSVASGASSVVIGGGSGELQEDRYSFAYGLHDPLMSLNALTSIYKFLADGSEKSSQKRAENAVLYMVRTGLIGDGSVSTGSVSGKGFEGNKTFLSRLPLGLAAPIREAMRTCQMAPPSDWPLEAYKAVGRDDVAASASAGGNGGTKGSGGDGGMEGSGGGGKDGYLGVREFIVRSCLSFSFSSQPLPDPFPSRRIPQNLAAPSATSSPRPKSSQRASWTTRCLGWSSIWMISLIFDSVRTGGWRRWRGCCVRPLSLL